MRKRKFIAVVVFAVSAALIGYSWVEFGGGPVLTWKVVDVRPHQYYYAAGHMQDCWRVEIEVSNMTSDEVIVDWNRDKSAFQIAGRWEDLGIAALMPYLPPHESQTFPVEVPQQAQACRVLMHYEHGPLWSTVDGFLRGHNINIPDMLFIPTMNFNKRLPGHFKLLDIEVKLPPNKSLQATRDGGSSSAVAEGVIRPACLSSKR